MILIIGGIYSSTVFGQGFDWQGSARLPFETPRSYLGFNLQYGFQFASGEISFLENQIQCPNFNDGNGKKFSIGLNFESWEKFNRFAYRTSLQYNTNYLSSSLREFVPYSSNLIAEFENKLTLNFSKIDFKIGGKYRIANSHLNFGADLMLSFVLNNSFEATEEILGPPEIPPFLTNPPSHKREILNGKINSFNTVIFSPTFTVGYDFQLGFGTYFEPHFTVAFPTNSMLTGDNLKNLSTSFGINFYRKFFK